MQDWRVANKGFGRYARRMSDAIGKWSMRGKVFVWRFLSPRTRHQALHLAAEPAACSALVELIELMRSGPETSHRTIKLHRPTERICAVPGYGELKHEDFQALRLQFDPADDDLNMSQEGGGKLRLSFGAARAEELNNALSEIGRGGGDFDLSPNQQGTSLPILFWWMPLWKGSVYGA